MSHSQPVSQVALPLWIMPSMHAMQVIWELLFKYAELLLANSNHAAAIWKRIQNIDILPRLDIKFAFSS